MSSLTMNRPSLAAADSEWLDDYESDFRATREEYARAEQLLKTEIEFIASDSFHDPDVACEMLESLTVNTRDRLESHPPSAPRDLPAHLARLCEAELLTAEDEQHMFRQMNFFKFKANALRASLDLDALDVDRLREAERLLRKASETRDQIVQANIRLVVSLTKKFVTPQHSFDELLSDGIMTLLRTVEKFDIDRGFRFSTYAYRSIARSLYHSIGPRNKNATFTSSLADDLDVAAEENSATMGEATWEAFRSALSDMLSCLGPREQFIIRGRYALGSQRTPHTFQSLGDQLGVSKERARQLEQRAVAQLQAMAADKKLEDLYA